jgi:hypothetical protein
VAAAHNDLSAPLKPPRVAAEVTTADEVFEIASSGAVATLQACPDAGRLPRGARRRPAPRQRSAQALDASRAQRGDCFDDALLPGFSGFGVLDLSDDALLAAVG